jgi:ATP-dependent Lon protease
MLRLLRRPASSVFKAALLRTNLVVLPGTRLPLLVGDYNTSVMLEAKAQVLPIACFLGLRATDTKTIGSLVTLEKVGTELVAAAALKNSIVELTQRDGPNVSVKRIKATKDKPMEHSDVLISLNSLNKQMNKLARVNLSRFEGHLKGSKTLNEYFYGLPYLAEVDYAPAKALKELELAIYKAALMLPFCVEGFTFSTLQSILEAPKLTDRMGIVTRFYTEVTAAIAAKNISVVKAAEAAQARSGNEVRKLAIKMLQEEVGQSKKPSKAQELREHFDSVSLPPKTQKIVQAELERMSTMSQESHEFEKIRNYLTHLQELPFGKFAEEHFDFSEAQKVLEQSHYGMQKVKERITEFLAVKKLKKEEQKGSVLLLLGPPGVGKSSVGKAIGAALRRPVRTISLGGCSEASFIRGHSRTYTGSKPGVFVRELQRAEVMNPVFILDEVDKMGSNSHHGDPQSALLDALNEEQNHDFHDDFLDIGIDLSKILFVLTANSDARMLDPLRNRLEIIEMPPYLVSEKAQIAQQYLLPDVLQRNGLGSTAISLKDEALVGIIKNYVEQEAGVRQLKKALDKIARKLAVESLAAPSSFTLQNYDPVALQRYLGSPLIVEPATLHLKLPIGKVNGLAVVGYGGSIMEIEAVAMPELVGNDTFEVTGNLKQVMSESVRNSRLCAARFAAEKGIGEFFNKTKIAVNFIGAAPKDGPSAGAAISIALLSLAQSLPITPNLAITGSIDLNLRIGRVGGIREKVTAAKTSEITRVCLPQGNKADWDDLPAEVRKDMTPVFVKTLAELFAVAFEKGTPASIEPSAETPCADIAK